ncbi:MAG TPA: LL-diaminopimelate aminotransferase [Deltaproteobacteria bacterium]|nr:LL-diaminopimelate aminotransferase [Deltaproteobacteria bacterium]HQI82186.1 LL-diaminopimelate aminotransferase [Deltaproteobacteria bacterium]
MIRINENYLKLKPSYLFSEIAKRVAAFQAANPDKPIIRLGIGDVTRALPEACITAFHRAVDEMASDATFKGYGPEQGYAFLREKIAEHDYRSRGADIDADEIFVSDGAKSDTANIQEIFSVETRVAIPDPVYPVYLDTNIMAGRAGILANGRYSSIVYLDCTQENGFVPDLPGERPDLIYLCFPNNPTGAVITKGQLKRWVDYARENRALILYDAAYEAFIRDKALPRSIYEIEGSREVAIEFRSFSKTAGFTGTRCAFTVVPKDCRAYDVAGNAHGLHAFWNRRQSTKMNGVSYPVQRAAEAVYSDAGRTQVKEFVGAYMANASLIRTTMQDLGFACTGGENSPYIWVKTGMDSWEFFDMLLEKASVVCTPGAGFGRCGEGYIRISAFNSADNVNRALERIRRVLQ